MANILKFSKVNALPGTLLPDTVYLVPSSTSSDLVEFYITNKTGTAVRHIPTESDIQGWIISKINEFTRLYVVADIAERDALSVDKSVQVYVKDASADPTVNSGAAMYVYDANNSIWEKVAEFESMDLILDWNDIQNKPTSAVTEIDEAVSKRHDHANKAVLDGLDKDADGNLTFEGKYIDPVLANQDW